MTWNELVTNLTRHAEKLRARFPHVDDESLRFVSEPGALVDHVAARHDLTPLEVEEEISYWLDVQSLARKASELRAS